MKIINGDCLEEMKKIEDDSIDLVIIDPPYEFCGGGGGGAFGYNNRSYHDEYFKLYQDKKANGEIDAEAKRINHNAIKQKQSLSKMCWGFDFGVLDELCRVMKKINIYVWCSKAQVRKILNYFEEKGCNTDIICWHKTNPTPTCNNTYLSDTEYCIFAREKNVKIKENYHTKKKYYVSPANVSDKKKYGHPTIKPLEIISNLIINSSDEGDTVLDCFMGSGTTGVACENTNRNFIGIELDEKYFNIAKERIEAVC